jgi:hypothetical protein
MHVVYDRPLDYPDNIVVRKVIVGAGDSIDIQVENDCLLYETIDEARADLPPGLTNLGRHPNDEPQIFEVWV